MTMEEVLFPDTNVILRHLTGSPPDQATRARALFRQVDRGEVLATTCETVVAEVIWVLTSPRGICQVDRAG